MVAVQEMVFTTKTNRQYRLDLERHAADSFACQVTQHSEPIQDLLVRSTGASALEAFSNCVAMLKRNWAADGADELVSVDNPSNTELLDCAAQSGALEGAVRVTVNGVDCQPHRS